MISRRHLLAAAAGMAVRHAAALTAGVTLRHAEQRRGELR